MLLLYPNPTNGNFTVNLGKNNSAVKITLLSLEGRPIQSSEYSNVQNLNLKIEEPSGVYLLRIESQTKTAILRLVKE